MRDLPIDVKYALRSLRRTPVFTLAASLTLALGIGANSAIFTLLDAVMFKPLGLPRVDDLVVLYESPAGPGAPSGTPDTTGGTGRFLRFSYPRFLRLQTALGDMGSLAAMTRSVPFAVRLESTAPPIVVRGQLVSGNYFATMGVSVARGRAFLDEDLPRAEAQPVAVVSDGFWKRAMGAAPDAVGRTIRIARVPVTVIGVAPRGFVGAWSDAESDLWMPLTMQQALGYQSNASGYGAVDMQRPWFQQNNLAWLNLFGRIRRDQLARAEATLKAVNGDALTDLSLEIPAPQRRSITSGRLVVEPFVRGFSGLRSRFASSLLALAGMVAIVLLVACANIANLVLARSTAAAREIGIRIALGASRARLVQQGFVESLLLASLGGASGLLLGHWISRALAAYTLGPASGPLPLVFELDARVLAFTAAITLGTALLVGLMPSIRATQIDVVARLGGGRGIVPGSLIRGMRPLVAAQIALSFVVVFAAVLFARSLVNFSRVDPGFSRDHVVAISFNPRVSGFSLEQMPRLRDRLAAAARSSPGVTSAAISTCGLLANCSQSSGFLIRNQTGIQLNENYVDAGYFATVGIPLKSGREFTDRDVENAPAVAIVSEAVATRYFGGTNPLGQEIGDDESRAEIVGVVGDVRPLSLRDTSVPMVYFPIAQNNQPIYTLAARVTDDAETQAIAIQRAMKTAEPGLVIDTAGGMNMYVTQATGRERLVTYLASALGALALLLACVGLYGVLSYAVARRVPELGVRAALGATPADLRDIVLRDAFAMIVGGTLAGLGAAWWANRLIQSLLFDVGIFDPLACVAVIALLSSSAVAACLVPAFRASRIDPLHARRQ